MEEDDFDFAEEVEDDMFAIDTHIQAERTVDPGKMAANRKAIIHNRVIGLARANVLSQQPPFFCWRRILQEVRANPPLKLFTCTI